MSSAFKIAIQGIGGVGGFIGAKLAAYYEQDDEIKIFFIARGENEKAIKQRGLKLITPENSIIARPAGVSSDAGLIGPADLVICCTKSYHLEDSAWELLPYVNNETLVLPLLNGVDATERLNRIFPAANILEGCIYLVSRLTAPGIVEKYGSVAQVYFGSEKYSKGKLKRIETIFRDAGIDTTFITNITERCWEKFFFFSTIATLTAYLDKTIGEIIATEDYKQQLLSLMKEFRAIAGTKNISLPENIIERSFATLASLPYESTTSMHTDFKKGNQTELRSVTEYVVKLGDELAIDTPVYDKMLAALVNRTRPL